MSVLLTPKHRAKGKFHYPTAGGVFKKLKNEDKDLFSFRNCKKWCKKAQNAIISLSFPSYMNWQPPENRLCIGERARREVAWRGLGSPQAVVYEWIRLSIVLPYADHLFSMTQDTFAAFLFKCNAGNWWCVYKPQPAINVRGFINPIRHLRVKVLKRTHFT